MSYLEIFVSKFLKSKLANFHLDSVYLGKLFLSRGLESEARLRLAKSAVVSIPRGHVRDLLSAKTIALKFLTDPTLSLPSAQVTKFLIAK